MKRKLQKNTARLRAAREELSIAEEQTLHLPEGEGDLEAMERHRVAMRQRIAKLEAEQDALLDQLGSG